MHNTAKCLVPIGTVESCVLRPRIPVGTRKESHLISQLSDDKEPFLDIDGEPNGLGINEAIPPGLEDGETSDP